MLARSWTLPLGHVAEIVPRRCSMWTGGFGCSVTAVACSESAAAIDRFAIVAEIAPGAFCGKPVADLLTLAHGKPTIDGIGIAVFPLLSGRT